jgi:chemotaxis protein CheC
MIKGLNEDQTAALQELANIGMGQAGNSLARIWKEFVHLSIPRIAMVDASRLPDLILGFVGDTAVSASRQAFHGGFRGEVLVVVTAKDRNGLAQLMGFEGQLDAAEREEVLLDIVNILGGACVGGIAQQVSAEIGFSAPSLIGEDLDPLDVINPEQLAIDTALSLEVCFQVENRSLTAHLVILLPNNEVGALADLLDQFLCTL